MKKFAYIHGWASSFDPDSNKIITISKEMDAVVVGTTLDYAKPREETIKALFDFIKDNNIDAIFGTSFGGYWAAIIGNMCGIPFVSINPVVEPAKALRKYVGSGTTYHGVKYNLTEEIVDQFSGHNFPEYGNGMVLLDQDDEVIDSNQTLKQLIDYHPVVFSGGSHRFDHMKEAIPYIQKFLAMSIVDGLA